MTATVTTTDTVMPDKAGITWHEANQDYLAASFSALRSRLEDLLCNRKDVKADSPASKKGTEPVTRPAIWNFSQPPALEQLCSSFDLSKFERDLLLLCAGAEMDVHLSELLTSFDSSRRPLPTFSLALTALHGAHWSALSPARALRYWHLIELIPADTLVSAPLRISERILHYLAGVPAIDERLQGLVLPLPQPENLPASYNDTARQIATAWAEAAKNSSHGSTATPKLPMIELCGGELEANRSIAATAAALLDLRLYVLDTRNLPQSCTAETNLLMRLWEREAVLSNNALLLESGSRDATDASSENMLSCLLELIHSPLVLSTHLPHKKHRPSRASSFTLASPPVSSRQRYGVQRSNRKTSMAR